MTGTKMTERELVDIVPPRLGESRLIQGLAHYYPLSPSAILIRTAEAELLRAVPIESPALDLCCGDGFFASLIRPTGFEAGCDISQSALVQAEKRNLYQSLAWADVAKEIPFPDGHFRTIVSNSSLEHVEGIDGALREIARVLKPGGRLYTTFASSYAREWWPCGHQALERYMEYQPVYNWFSFEEWERRMNQAGLRIVDHQYYLSKAATRLLLFLDYHLSHVYMTSDRTIARSIVKVMRKIPPGILARIWVFLFANIRILAESEGGGILIVAERSDA
jgi:ubiquinone/menaquinone biosynthesis C-methylase UbiE